MTTIDRRALIPIDYKQLPIDELQELKQSIMHTITINDRSNEALHREYTAIRIELATRKLGEMEGETVKE